MEELIERLKNIAFNISAITIDTDGSVHHNEKLIQAMLQKYRYM